MFTANTTVRVCPIQVVACINILGNYFKNIGICRRRYLFCDTLGVARRGEVNNKRFFFAPESVGVSPPSVVGVEEEDGSEDVGVEGDGAAVEGSVSLTALHEARASANITQRIKATVFFIVISSFQIIYIQAKSHIFHPG